jgi:hypothetical protein
MKDTELFLAELITKELFLDQAKTLLTEMAIFRDNNSVLHSNCEEYYGIQRLRKAMIENNREIITQEVKRISTTTSSDILKSIAIMTLNRPELPDWGKLV